MKRFIEAPEVHDKSAHRAKTRGVPVDIVTDTLRRVCLQYMCCISKVKGEKAILNILKQKMNTESCYLFNHQNVLCFALLM